MERLTARVRRKMMPKFPEYFPMTRTSIVKENEIGEMIYYPDFFECQHILTWMLKHEGERFVQPVTCKNVKD
jgi:hypothetical protein